MLFAGLTPQLVGCPTHTAGFEAGRNVLTIEQPGETVYIILHGTVKFTLSKGNVMSFLPC
jgi:hypothetical protein